MSLLCAQRRELPTVPTKVIQGIDERLPLALFPVSLLARAPVRCCETEIGRCVDAMAGCRSGRLDYVVVSQGGVAGVGETLRRLPWIDAEIDDDRLVSRLQPDQFAALEELSKDEWPGR